ncbi:MAG: DUF2219 family protein [Flavobacteriales bacterium]|nr:DUF2219 family protein [Flavobacteriales bacterium]
MKRLGFVLLIIFASDLKAQVDSSLLHLISTNNHSAIANALSNPDHALFKKWIRNRVEREAAIKYCDEAIENYYEIVAYDYFSTFRETTQKSKTRSDSLKRRKFNRYFNKQNFDTSMFNKDTIDNFTKSKFDSIGFKGLVDFIKPLRILLNLEDYTYDSKKTEVFLSLVRSHHTLQILYNDYENLYIKEALDLPGAVVRSNLKLISSRLDEVESNDFVLYQSNSSEISSIKGVELFMDNDVFLFNGRNQDREYTGGGVLSFSTDYLKWQWINLGWLKGLVNKKDAEKLELKKRRMLSYQSVALGMHFFTPYIRYRNNYELADSLYLHDRPFGSFIYLERSKYRLWPKGLVRMHIAYQLGQVGSQAGKNVQGTLHKDAATSSQKVYGWHKQIANGGRWAAQINTKLDLMLYSTNNEFQSVFTPNRNRLARKKYSGINLYNSTEFMAGGFLSAIGSGIYISTLNFTQRSGQNQIAARKKGLYEFGIFGETGLKYRYILHNSMLEGFRYLNTIDDDPYDDEAETSYSLVTDKIHRNLLIWESRINLRWRKMVIFYSMVFQTKEYELSPVNYDQYDSYVKMDDKDYYKQTVIKELTEFNNWKWYGYGTFGLVWIMD